MARRRWTFSIDGRTRATRLRAARAGVDLIAVAAEMTGADRGLSGAAARDLRVRTGRHGREFARRAAIAADLNVRRRATRLASAGTDAPNLIGRTRSRRAGMPRRAMAVRWLAVGWKLGAGRNRAAVLNQIRAPRGHAGFWNDNVAHMAARRVVIEPVVVIDIIAWERRLPVTPDLPAAHALQAIDIGGARRAQLPGDGGVGRFSELFARGPEETAA